ncbi:DUF2306 domain-containing protein [Tunicatimonas pelagia]|uniref:DUF2306 domain-containing protein n=1 Tax=Tunicatimonas pelagia TaxID=931531 RepID=UPI002665F3C9|nr:DUF2306 domain-containing protein [Tunicatimonas pelagia]WKN45946.1 DUF2306 domain-containing protein [Tunicatimonas pelagia]
MKNLVHDPLGAFHLGVAVLSLITGTLVLLLPKGSVSHTQIGYVYAISMLLVNITAFSIYRLWGGFGIFHIAAVVSLVTLLGGMVPVLTKRPKQKYMSYHFSFMYWSVIGLYAAFASETLTRIPETPFFGMVGVATFSIMITASWYFRRHKEQWNQQFNQS